MTDATQIGRFLRLKEVKSITGFSTSSIYEAMNAGKFPNSVKLNPDSQRSPVAWLESEIRNWQLARIADRSHLGGGLFHAKHSPEKEAAKR